MRRKQNIQRETKQILPLTFCSTWCKFCEKFLPVDKSGGFIAEKCLYFHYLIQQKAEGERNTNLKMLPYGVPVVFIANDKIYLHSFSGAARVVLRLLLPQVLLVTLPRAEGSLPQCMSCPFMAHGLGSSGLGNLGIHRWKQSYYKTLQNKENVPRSIYRKYFWMT